MRDMLERYLRGDDVPFFAEVRTTVFDTDPARFELSPDSATEGLIAVHSVIVRVHEDAPSAGELRFELFEHTSEVASGGQTVSVSPAIGATAPAISGNFTSGVSVSNTKQMDLFPWAPSYWPKEIVFQPAFPWVIDVAEHPYFGVIVDNGSSPTGQDITAWVQMQCEPIGLR